MARLSRLEIAHWPHLLSQHVLAGELLVRDGTDRQMLWMAMLDSARQTQVAVHAYAVLDDHFHMVVTPSLPDSLSAFMQGIGRRYVAKYNHRHGRAGTLWAGRFRGTVLSPEQHLQHAMLFVETHPNLQAASQVMVEGVLGVPKSEFGYSSLPHHLFYRTDPLVLDHALFWQMGNTPFERESLWRLKLQSGLSTAQRSELSEAMRKGWALIDSAQAALLARTTDRRLAPRPRGRPKQTTTKAP